MEATVLEPPAPTPVRSAGREWRPRPARYGGRRCRSLVSIWVGPTTFLQFTSGIDCMIALLIGLLGGILAGMALARVRTSDERPEQSTRLSRTASIPVPTPETTESRDRSLRDAPPQTDEERIVRLLASNDGRMKQSRIVDGTDWSKAKVSRLLSSMEENEEITKLTVGRENIIFLGSMDGVYVSNDGSKD